MKSGFSVIMPTYNQCAFIRNAIQSLLNQTNDEWELIIVNDGATDDTDRYVLDFLSNPKIRYVKNPTNRGLGGALNQGLDMARYDYIAYLPSDDFYYTDHLETLKDELSKSEDIVLTYVKVKSDIQDTISNRTNSQINGLFYHKSLQLVQVAHKKTSDRWVERDEWVSDNLFDLFWNKLTDKGIFTFIDKETAVWTIHTKQHHQLINGGVNKFRQHYNIRKPIRMKTSRFRFIDEEDIYKDFRSPIPAANKTESALKVLIVGELAYHPERIYALEENGCELYGLWMPDPTFDMTTVGPLPFGNVTEVPYENWEAKIREIEPDVIYACLNFGAVNIAHEVLKKCPDIPFVWHFKEGPFLCRQHGTWGKLIELYDKADGKIYINEEARDWYEQFFPQGGYSLILDGDLPKQEYFSNNFSARLSESDGAIHTMVPGRLIGISIEDMKLLAKRNVHVHLYTPHSPKALEGFNKGASEVAPGHFHIHNHCSAKDWTSEFSKYDAGWLHPFTSSNYGDMKRIGWNDLNMPARMSTLAAAGLPMIQVDNSDHIVGMQSCAKRLGLGIFYNDMEDLADKLYDKKQLEKARENCIENRLFFSFDHHVHDLIDLFKKVVNSKKQ